MAREFTPLYNAWRAMRERCHYTGHVQYKDYGGRGIRCCERWASFAAFAADMGPHPGKGWTLDRIDNDGDYRPGNVRWATYPMQRRNSRRVCKLSKRAVAAIRKSKLGAVEIARKYGVVRGTVWRVRTRKIYRSE